ncbi:MAG: porphobilinogen synthase [Candidatus Omnitrophica bacterium]|nr:porphobilinogen synthase [Candidatus Omnitrophota bacterium]
MSYPLVRLRRLRENPKLRRFVSEHKLFKKDLAQPIFVKEGIPGRVAVASMPGQFQFSEAEAVEEAKKILDLGVPAVILFGIPSKKDARGFEAFAKKGIIQRAVAKIKKSAPGLLVITDVCLCEYLTHGHCGHVRKGRVLNDSSVATLARVALSHAEAGADVVAPSDMMDGRVLAIRRLLDRRGFEHLPVMSYAVKYASSFYAPFRDAAESAPGFGDRSGYQMDPANAREAFREVEADLAEGADLLLVKPALGYGDVIRRVVEKFSCPVGCYSVSGEYSMIKAAAERGWVDEKKTVLETHLSMKRAGAAFIVSYWAKDIARWETGGGIS